MTWPLHVTKFDIQPQSIYSALSANGRHTRHMTYRRWPPHAGYVTLGPLTYTFTLLLHHMSGTSLLRPHTSVNPDSSTRLLLDGKMVANQRTFKTSHCIQPFVNVGSTSDKYMDEIRSTVTVFHLTNFAKVIFSAFGTTLF